ncbi:MAG: type II CAAX endopeptidase family protein [Chitinophagaceae bacterium]
MKGLLKGKPAGTQLLILISIALLSLFILGLAGTMILSAMTGINITEISEPAKWDMSKPGFLGFLRGMQVVQFIALFLIPTFLCARLFSTDTNKYLGLKKPSTAVYFLVATAAFLLAIPLVSWLGEINKSIDIPGEIGKWMKQKEDEIAIQQKALLSRHTIKDLILNIVCIAGLAAIGEELLFRGIAQRLLIKIFKSPLAGIIVAAFLFSAMHLQFYGFFPRFVLGILLGLIYWYSGSLWVPILAHFMYDAVLVTLLYFNPSMANEDTPVPAANIALMAAASFLAIVGLVGWMKKRSTVTYQEVYVDDAVPDHPF